MPGVSSPSDPKSRIPVTLVTGFLGSGKTTLINAALSSPEMSRTMIVVNEFGEVGLDQKLFVRSSDTVVVLENGCLCCTVRSDLVGTLNSLFYNRKSGEIPFFDNVVIETSGLAEPGPVLIPGAVLITLAVIAWPLALALLPFLAYAAGSPIFGRQRIDRKKAAGGNLVVGLRQTVLPKLPDNVDRDVIPPRDMAIEEQAVQRRLGQ